MRSFYHHLNVSKFYEKHSFEQEAEKKKRKKKKKKHVQIRFRTMIET